MTSPHSVDYPRPKDWQQFERLCRGLMSEVYGKQFQRWGRSGQRQNGIDAFLMKEDGRAVGIQCKGRSNGLGSKLSMRDINSALASIDSFTSPLDEFIILTTANDDVSLHVRTAELSSERLALGKCSVSVWGWDTISDHIGAHEQIQRAYFGHWFQRISFRQWAARASAVCLLVAFSAVGALEYRDWRRLKAERIEASIRELQTFVKLTDDLKTSYVKCHNVLTDNMFTFSARMTRSCTEPVAVSLSAIEKQIEKVGALLDSDAWNEINALSKLMTEDYRQGLIAVEITKHFEDQVISDLKEYCVGPSGRRTGHPDDKAAYRAARDAMTLQLNYYFVLRDFILPGLRSMKARALVHARNLAGEAVPEDLEKQANALTPILDDRRGYKYLEPKQPFTISAIKVWSNRSISTPTDSEDSPVEQARWHELHLAATTKVFYGRPNDIERLIECGVLKPEARELAKMM